MAKAEARITANSSDFQQKMKEMVNQMKSLSSEFGVAQAQAKLLGNASDVLKSKIAELTSKVELQKDVVKANEEQHERLTSDLEKERAKHETLTAKLQQAKAAYSETAAQTGKNSDESKALKSQISDLEQQLGKCTTSIEKQEKGLANHEAKTNKSKIALAEMELELRELNAELAKTPWDNFAKGADKVASAAESAGKKMTVVSTAIVAAGTYSAKAAIEFESAFTGVKKTVDGTAEQLESLKQGIIDMSKELPASTTEISAVAEAAGQLGIKTDDILSFTRVMIDLGEATNLSADEAATALAKFANVVKMDAANYDRLGSTIVALGNNFATTEADIVSMATRLASTGEVVGLSEAQIMAIATALSSVGIEAEAGGSAVSKLLKQMEVAVQMYGTASQTINATGYSLRELELMASLNSKEFKGVAESLGLTTTELKNYMSNASSLEQFANVAGVSADQFIQAWGTDAVGALSMFIGGLNDTERTGKSAVELLNEMGLTEVRLSNAVLSLASSDGVLTSALETSNAAWDQNNALTNEATQRYATTESRIAMMKNTISALAVSFGEKLLPIIESAVAKISELAEKFNGLSDSQQQTIIKVAAVVAAIGPALLAFSKLASGASTVATIIGKVSGAIAGAGGLSGVLSAVCSPVGLVVAAIAALVVGLGYVIATNDDVRGSLLSVINDLKSAVQPAIEFITNTVIPNLQTAWERLQVMLKPFADFLVGMFTSCWTDFIIPALEWVAGTVIPTVTATFQNLWNNVIVPLATFLDSVFTPVIRIVSEVLTMLWNNVVVPLAQAIGGVFATAWEGMMKIFNEVVIPRVNKVIQVLQFLWTNVLQPVVEWLWNTFQPIFQNVFEFIGGLFGTLKEIFSGLINFVVGVFTGDWKQAWEGIKQIFSGLWDSIVLYVEYVCNQFNTIFGDAFRAIGQFFTDLWNGIKDFFVNLWNSIVQFCSNTFNSIKEKATSIFTAIRDTLANIWEGIKNVVQVGIMFIVNLFKAAFDLITLPFRFIWENCKDTIMSVWNSIKSTIDTVLNSIKTAISTAWNAVKTTVTNAVNAIKSTVSSVWNSIKSAIDTVLNSIKTAVSTAFNAVKTTITNAVNSAKSTVTSVFNSIKSAIDTAVNGAKNTITNVFNSIKTTISNAVNSVKNTVQSVFNSIKSAMETPINNAKNAISNAFNSVKSSISNTINSIKSTVQSVFNSIKSAIETPINNAKNTVTNVISKIKSAFNFSWSLPKLKLPHFSIKGEFSLSPPSVPYLSIDWYKNGGIMTQPTVFGAVGTRLLAGGEAGAEAILPLEPFYQRLSAILDSKYEKLKENNIIRVTAISMLDGEVIAEHTTEMVTDNIVKDVQSRR